MLLNYTRLNVLCYAKMGDGYHSQLEVTLVRSGQVVAGCLSFAAGTLPTSGFGAASLQCVAQLAECFELLRVWAATHVASPQAIAESPTLAAYAKEPQQLPWPHLPRSIRFLASNTCSVLCFLHVFNGHVM